MVISGNHSSFILHPLLLSSPSSFTLPPSLLFFSLPPSLPSSLFFLYPGPSLPSSLLLLPNLPPLLLSPPPQPTSLLLPSNLSSFLRQSLVSGGVDSAVCTALLHSALGSGNVIALHIDNGFMRKEESKKVKDSLEKLGLHPVG